MPRRYAVTDISGPDPHGKFLPGGASALNDHGQVVGKRMRRAALWPGKGVQPQFVPGLNPRLRQNRIPDTPSSARSINNQGQIVGDHQGLAFIAQVSAEGSVHPARRLVIARLPVVDRDTTPAAVVPVSVNGRGEVAGQSWAYDSKFPQLNAAHAFFWREGGAVVDLHTFGDRSFATGLNDNGVVVGYVLLGSWEEPEKGVHAFSWTEGVMRDLGTLPGHFCSYAHAINNEGAIVGASEPVLERGYLKTRAVRWDGRSDITDLGSGEAYDLNDHGQIVGAVGWEQILGRALPENDPRAGQQRAVLWENGKRYFLDDLVPKNPGLRFYKASAINNRGQIVALAHAKAPYWERAVLLNPR